MNIEYPRSKKEEFFDNNDTLVLEEELKKDEKLDVLEDSNIIHSENLDSLYEKENEKVMKGHNFQEYKEEKRKEREENQIEADKLIEDLSSVDFNNQEVLLDWLCKFKEVSTPGVEADGNKAIYLFNKNGYRIISGKFDKNFLEDKDKYARYIVGKALYEIFMDVSSQEINDCVKQWKEKFGGK